VSHRLVSRPGLHVPGVETSLDAAGKSACATKLFAAREDFQI